MAALHYYDDFTVGYRDRFGPYRVTKDEIIAFARQFDPQPFHLSEEAGKASMLGGLAASGWHSCAMGMKLIADGFLNDSKALGAPGIEEVKWLKPVMAGDELTMAMEVLEAVPSQSRPEMGRVRFQFTLMRPNDEPVMSQRNWILFERRPA